MQSFGMCYSCDHSLIQRVPTRTMFNQAWVGTLWRMRLNH
jgi:hypothetical protein